MPQATWNDQLTTGIELIDAQHRELFAAVARLGAHLGGALPEAQLAEELADLAQATTRHFHTEETLLKAAGFPTRIAHADQHRDLLLKVRELQYLQAKGQGLPEGLDRFLAEWFDHHIREVDQDSARYLRAQAGH